VRSRFLAVELDELVVAELRVVGAGDLAVLADRIARNRELAGLHYESDSKGGAELAKVLFSVLTNAADPISKFNEAFVGAVAEWQA